MEVRTMRRTMILFLIATPCLVSRLRAHARLSGAERAGDEHVEEEDWYEREAWHEDLVSRVEPGRVVPA
jgi:hypothetical protein